MLGPPLNINTQLSSSENNNNKDNTNTNNNNNPTISSGHFEKITQLPTPILNNGSFTTFNQQQSSLLLSPPKEPSIYKSTSSRVISDYKPSARNHNLNTKSTTNKRFVSNPLDLKHINNDDPSSLFDSINNNDNSRIQGPLTPSTSPVSSTSSTAGSSYSSNDYFYSSKLNSSFQFSKQLGTGNFSTVVLAKDPVKSTQIAIKIISIPSQQQYFNFKSFIKRELNILYHLSNHPCITKLIDYSITLNISRDEIENDEIIDEEISQPQPQANSLDFNSNNNKQYIFMNYCQGGNLLHFLMANNYKNNSDNLLYWQYLRRIVCELLYTINYLHANNIIHRDIKLENVLLSYTFEQIKSMDLETFNSRPLINLSDFGLSKKLSSPTQLLSTRCGSQDYIAPEILMGLNYNGKLTDSWSIGVLIFAMLENKLPFDMIPEPSSTQTSPQQKSQSIYHDQSRISPSVLKRRRSRKNSPAHRIAMIDWEWFSINERIENTDNDQIKQILIELKFLVDILLVRKIDRLTIEKLLLKFNWISNSVPDFIKL